MKNYLWLLKTNKDDFFITVVGNWTQEESEEKVRLAFARLELNINSMTLRKRITGPDEAIGIILQQEDKKNGLEFQLYGSKKLWEACGRLAEYEVEQLLLKKKAV